jgi:hypothetical protein
MYPETNTLPKQHTSSLQGEVVDLRINPACRGIFALGCQGPDIFYHSRRTRPVALEYGSLLHRRGYGTFCENLLPAEHKNNDNDIDKNPLAAYALGFMTHAVLDRFCHPYIVYKSCGDIYHPFFERIIDVLMLKALRDQEASSWDQGLLVEVCENPPAGLKERIVCALAATFPEKAGRDEKLSQRIDNAFADSARFYRLTDPAQTRMEVWGGAGHQLPLSSRFLSVIFPENLPDDIDFLNLKREPWFYPYHPPGAEVSPLPDTRSFPDIYADAVEAAINVIPTGTFRAENIGNGCLSIHDENGKPCAPNLASPLPLDAVLEAQCRTRSISLDKHSML